MRRIGGLAHPRSVKLLLPFSSCCYASQIEVEVIALPVGSKPI